MSFSTTIKNEVTRLDSTKTEYIAELSAIIRNASVIGNSIKITLENNAVARRIYSLLKSTYGIIPIVSVRKGYNFHKNFSYVLEIKEKIKQILTDLSIVSDNNEFLSVPLEYIISDDDEIRAYLRGLFISSGSVNDPKTSRYHLELMVSDNDYAMFIKKILDGYNLNSKVIKREKNYMVYIKEAEKISDFLRIIKAYNAVLYFEDIRIYRDHKNMTNRLNNCEQANMDKIFSTANNQLADIEIILGNDMLDILDDKLQEVISYRLKYRESSLQELGNIISMETGNYLSKSGLNHRFRKIKEIANKIRESKE